MFSEKHLTLPALSVVQIGALPGDNAQVLLEAIIEDKKPANPNGLAFISGQAAYTREPLKPVVPMVEKAAARLRTAVRAAGIDAGDVLRIDCYLTSLDETDKVRALVGAQFPRATLALMQPLRATYQSGAECGAVARLSSGPRVPLEFVNPPELDGPSQSSAVALVGPYRVALSSAQLAFGAREDDARLAFVRLGKSLEQVTASYDKTAVAHIYSVSQAVGNLAQKAGAVFFDKSTPPAETVLPFEGLPSMDASFAVDVIVVLPERR
jgi:enamine deaminase RidA (YjgF/YER057c/UK114 family)